MLALYQLVGPRILRYSVDSKGVDYVLLGKFRLRSIAHGDIEAAEVMSRLDVFLDESLGGFQGWGLPNRIAWQVVVLRLRSGRALALTPRDPCLFARAVMERSQWPVRNQVAHFDSTGGPSPESSRERRATVGDSTSSRVHL